MDILQFFFSCVFASLPSIAKKLGGKLEVVSYDDDLEGGFPFFFSWKLLHSGVNSVSSLNRVCVFLCSWRKAPSCSYRSLCIRNRSDICGSELESSCLFQQGSHVVLHRKGRFCMDCSLCLDWRNNMNGFLTLQNSLNSSLGQSQTDTKVFLITILEKHITALVWVHSTSFIT